MAEPDRPVHAAECSHVRGIGNLRWMVDNLKDPSEQCQRAGDVDVQVAQRARGSGQPAGEDGHHADDRPHCALASYHQIATEQQEERRSERKEHVVEQSKPAADHRLANLESFQLLVDSAEAATLGALFGERFDQQDARDAQHLLHVAAHLRQLFLGLLASTEGRLADVAAGDQHDWHQDQRGQGQAPVEGQHQHQRAGHGDHIRHQSEDRLRDDVLDTANIIAHSRKQIARAATGEESDRLAQQPIEQLLAQVEHDSLADRGLLECTQDPDQAASERGRDARSNQQR